MKRLISSFAALVAVACLVSACGQKARCICLKTAITAKRTSRTSTSTPSRPQQQASCSRPSSRQRSKETHGRFQLPRR
jgi:hypothetical protein